MSRRGRENRIVCQTATTRFRDSPQTECFTTFCCTLVFWVLFTTFLDQVVLNSMLLILFLVSSGWKQSIISNITDCKESKSMAFTRASVACTAGTLLAVLSFSVFKDILITMFMHLDLTKFLEGLTEHRLCHLSTSNHF